MSKKKICNEEEITIEECHCEEECSCDEECSCGEECECNHNDEVELLGNRIRQLEEALLRNQAELMNYKKRKEEETNRILKYAEEDILRGFLPILDNFERAIGMDNDDLDDEVSKFLEGFKLMHKQIKDLLIRFEVYEVDILDKEFDPATSQAVIVDKDESKESVYIEVI